MYNAGDSLTNGLSFNSDFYVSKMNRGRTKGEGWSTEN